MTINETKEYAENIARSISPRRRIFALTGDLGAGKTAFTKFFFAALGVHEAVTSPTFVIMKTYQLPGPLFLSACHVDCYRLLNPHELITLGFGEKLLDPHVVIVVEWADRIRSMLPLNTVWIAFSHQSEGDRRIIALD